LAESLGDFSVLLEAVYSEFPCADLVELAKFLSNASVSDGTSDQFADDGGGLNLVRHAWWEARPHLQECATDVLRMVLELAAERLNRIRIRLLMRGQALGQQLSLGLTQLTTAIGRDQTLVDLALKDFEKALTRWEAARSRALTDWMGRTHKIDEEEMVLRCDFEGVVGEITPASLQEIKKAVAQVQAPILAYFAHDDGIHVWLVGLDGTIKSEAAGPIDGLVDKLMAKLPYGANREDLFRGALDDFFLDTDDSSEIDETLDELTRQVIPKAILDELLASGATRVVIMPDAELDMLPFCCLRTNGRYLVESFEISYWPCVSAWLLCYRTMHWRQNLSPVIFGNPDFSALKQEGLDFAPLSESEAEATYVAKKLNVEPTISEKASAETLRALYRTVAPRRAGIPILHLATHGVLDMRRPERSFVALAKGGLTVADLRLDDEAYRTGLTVLSACQTGLGHRHPDSVIGLTSGFFIAGACAIISSLWKVPDAGTRTLMERFYDNLLASPQTRPAAALASAQRQALQNPKTAHPFRWAALRLAGADLHPCPHLVRDDGATRRLQDPVAAIEQENTRVRTGIETGDIIVQKKGDTLVIVHGYIE
jgi:CHAT domain